MYARAPAAATNLTHSGKMYSRKEAVTRANKQSAASSLLNAGAPVAAGASLTPPPVAAGLRAGGGTSPRSALMGRLTDGTLHRQSVLETLADRQDRQQREVESAYAVPSASSASAAATASEGLAAVVQESASHGTWAARFDTAADLRAAVATDKDAQTKFELSLVEEVNLLRRDPAGYAVILEHEATLGYPYVCDDDEYFDSDAAATTVHGYRPDILDPFVGKRDSVVSGDAGGGGAGPRPISAGSNGSARAHGEDGAASRTDGGGSHRPHSRSSGAGGGGGGGKRLGKATHPAQPQRASGATDAALPPTTKAHHTEQSQGSETHSLTVDCDSRPDSPALFRSTLKSSGMAALNLAQLRTHFRRHQRHRTALEAALQQIALGWQQAQQAQREAWAQEDDKTTKKQRRANGSSVANGGGGGGGGGRNRSTNNAAGIHEEVGAARKAAMETLNAVFAGQLRSVYAELEKERDACGRAMEGANAILDCIRALREAQPAPPLRYSRGLTLAAREASVRFHASESRVSALAEAMRGIARRVSRASDTCGGEIGRTSSLAEAMAGAEASRGDSEDEADKTSALLDMVLQQLDSVNRYPALGSDGASTTAGGSTGGGTAASDVLSTLNLTPGYLRGEIEDLANTMRASCDTYGYVSGEVRGLQLYGAGSARALVMRALLGVMEPVFSFTEKARTFRGGTVVQEPSTDAVRASGGGDAAKPQPLDARIFDKSVFHDESEAALAAPCLPAKDLSVATALVLCGDLHPTTAAAARHFAEPELTQTTKAGRRAAQASRRLGPLLWSGAHLMGCSWQQVRPQQGLPTFEQALAEQQQQQQQGHDKDNAVGEEGEGVGGVGGDGGGVPVLVGTTLVVASGFEELDVVRRYGGGAFGLEEIRRVVYERLGDSAEEAAEVALADGNSRRGKGGSTGGVRRGLRSAVVDMHSALGVELLEPLTHPMRFPATAAAAAGSGSRHGSGVATIVANAEAKRVQLQACVTAAADATIPSVPILDPELVLVQRSADDVDVTIILVDVHAVAKKLMPVQGNAGSPAGLGALVHIYEISKELVAAPETSAAPHAHACSEKEDASAHSTCEPSSETGGGVPADNDVTGYVHIGFIRLIIADGSDISSSGKGSLRAESQAVSLTGSAIRTVPHLRSPAAAHAQPFLASLDLSARSGTASSALTTATAHAADYAGQPCGWPMVSQDFTDRCGSILAPLSSFLPAGGDDDADAVGGSGQGLVRVAVRLPEMGASDYLRRHVTALKAQLHALQSLHQQEEKAEEYARGSQAPSAAPTALPAPTSPSPRDPALDAVTATDGGSPSSSTASPKPRPESRESAGGKGARLTSAASAATQKKRAQARDSAKHASPVPSRASAVSVGGGEGSETSDAALSPELQAMLVIPLQTYRARGYFDAAHLTKMPMPALQAAVQDLAAASADCQGRLQRAQAVLEGELARMRAEAERRKGRELIRLKNEETDIAMQLDNAQKAVADLVAGAALAKDVLVKRTRDRAMRLARMEKLAAELASYDAANLSSGVKKPDVVLWLRAPVSSPPPPAEGRTGTRTTPPPAAAPSSSPEAAASVVEPHTCGAASHSHCVPLTPSHEAGSGVFEAVFRLPTQFRGGRAVLFVDGIEDVAWRIL